MIQPTDKIWHNGEFINWDDAKVHVLTHALHYGTSVFEGLRCYDTANGPAIFRLPEHIRRLFDSAKIYRMDNLGFDQTGIIEACKDVRRVNNLTILLHPPDCIPWTRGCRRTFHQQSSRVLHCLLGVGKLSRLRST